MLTLCEVGPRDGLQNEAEALEPTTRAELRTDGADDQIDKLAKKYLGQDTYPWRSADEQRVSVRIRPEQVDATGFDS